MLINSKKEIVQQHQYHILKKGKIPVSGNCVRLTPEERKILNATLGKFVDRRSEGQYYFDGMTVIYADLIDDLAQHYLKDGDLIHYRCVAAINDTVLAQWGRLEGFTVTRLSKNIITFTGRSHFPLYWVRQSASEYAREQRKICLLALLNYHPDVKCVTALYRTFVTHIDDMLLSLKTGGIFRDKITRREAVLLKFKTFFSAEISSAENNGYLSIDASHIDFLYAMLNIDHVANKKSLQQYKDAFILMYPINQYVNQQAGRVFESATPAVFNKFLDYGFGKKELLTFDYIHLFKCLAISYPQNYAELEHVAKNISLKFSARSQHTIRSEIIKTLCARDPALKKPC